MNCEKAHKQIALFSELDNHQQDYLQEHLQECSGCHAEFVQYQLIQKQIRKIRENRGLAPLPSDFSTRIQQQIHPHAAFNQIHPKIAWFRQQKLLQAAAGILFLAGLIQFLPYFLPQSNHLGPNLVDRGIIYHSLENPIQRISNTPQQNYFTPVSKQDRIVEEIQRKKNIYLYNSVPTSKWSEGTPYSHSTPIFMASAPTDF